jgi:hypothetical protein
MFKQMLSLVLACFILLLNGFLFAQAAAQKSFASPADAGKALFAAVLADDSAAMLDLFGPGANEIISMGDGVEAKNTRDQFVARYREMHRLGQEPDGTKILYIGADSWPLPVPLVQESGMWRFDAEAGVKEILYRRIGENEYAAMNIVHALVEAQNDYYSQPRDGQVQQYAQMLASDEGKHNGLYWKTADGEPESPIGPLVAYAAGGYGDTRGYENNPLHGYYYRILTGQREAAAAGDKSYIVNGKMIGGFAILAYPADYRSSGVMTFIVNQTGVVYQKDLGDGTREAASAMRVYALDEAWKKAE